jgi:hypothetical protein
MVLLGKARKKNLVNTLFFHFISFSTTSPFSSKCQGIGKNKKAALL